MHTLKTVPISLCRHTYVETVIFTVGFVHACFSMVMSDLCFCLTYIHYTNLLLIMTKVHNILSKVNNMNSIEQFLAHSLIMVLNVS